MRLHSDYCHWSTVFSLALLAAVAGCADGSNVREAAGPAGPPEFLVTHDSGKLTVNVTGPGRVQYPPFIGTYDASVSGGTGPYYYVWFWRPCYTNGCNGQFYKLTEGANLSSAQVTFATYTRWVQVEAQVRENKSAPYNTGRSQFKLTFGPAGFGGSVQCPSPDMPTVQPYPFDTAQLHFVYGPCSLDRIYQ